MKNILRTGGLAVAAIATVLAVASPATARPWHRHYYGHHGHYGYGAGAAVGFATGALIGSALARPYYGGEPYYAYQPDYTVDGTEQYCMQRFKSYDPGSGTYLGYDGVRHPCP